MASNYPSPLMSPSTTGSVHLGLLGHPNFVSYHSPPPSLPDSLHILSWITIPSPHPPVIADAYQHFEYTLSLFLLIIYKPNPSLPFGYRCQYIMTLYYWARPLSRPRLLALIRLFSKPVRKVGSLARPLPVRRPKSLNGAVFLLTYQNIIRNLSRWSSLRIRVSERRSYISLLFWHRCSNFIPSIIARIRLPPHCYQDHYRWAP